MSAITNIVASFAVSILTTTNDIPRWTPQSCTDGLGSWTMHIDEAAESHPLIDVFGRTNFVRFAGFSNMTEETKNDRVRVIQTKRVTSLSFEWNGKKREVTDEEIMDEKRVMLVRKESWEPKGERKDGGK
jgi:hypothetical protein